MTTEGVDYAWQKPTPAALAAAGKAFACRYLSYRSAAEVASGSPGKTLTATEAKALTAAGVAVVSNWEWSSGDARKGYIAGRTYATEALKQATACGMPVGRPIFFSVDFEPAAGDWAAISEYFRGIRSVLGVERTGIYGGYNTIARAVSGKWAAWFWQTFAWSNGRWHPSSHIQQYRNGVTLDGADLDLDRAMVADYGQWTVGTPTPIQEYDVSVETDQIVAAWSRGMPKTTTGEAVAPVDWRIRDEAWQASVDKQLAALAAQAQAPIDYDKLAAALLRRIAATPAS